MKIALGSDHAGFEHKEAVKHYLLAEGMEVLDFGTDSSDAVDYPDYIRPAAESVSKGEADLGIVFGGSGNGEAIVANKVSGIRCGLCWNRWSAEMTKKAQQRECDSHRRSRSDRTGSCRDCFHLVENGFRRWTAPDEN